MEVSWSLGKTTVLKPTLFGFRLIGVPAAKKGFSLGPKEMRCQAKQFCFLSGVLLVEDVVKTPLKASFLEERCFHPCCF